MISGAVAAATATPAALPSALRQNAQAVTATQTATSANANSTTLSPREVETAAITESANANIGPRTLAPATSRRATSSVTRSTPARALSQEMSRNIETASSAAGRTIPSRSELVRAVAPHSATVARMTTPWT